MKSRNKREINKFLINSDDMNNNKINEHMIKTDGNRKSTPNVNKNRSKSNSKSYNNKINTTSQKNRSKNKTNNIFNQKILEIIRNTEEQLGSLNSKNHIQYAVKILEAFQEELIGQLEQEYDENSIKKILQNNFDKIIRLLIEYFTLYDNNCSNCISNLKKMLKNLLNTNVKLFIDINLHKEESYSNKSNKNNNIPLIDEDKRKEFLNEEEIIVKLINSLSGGIKTCNKNYRTTILEIAKLIEESNNGLIELKNKLEQFNNQLKSKYMPYIQIKNNINLYMDNIINNVDNLYSMNINIIEDVKILDTNQTSFYEDAKEIFNHLKTNHSKKLKEFHILFKSITYIQSNINSNHQINNKRGKSISGNRDERKQIREEEKEKEKEKNSDKIKNWENKMKTNNSSKNYNTNNNYEHLNNITGNIILNDNINNITIFTLAEQVLDFFNKMKNLQESIVKKNIRY